MDDLESPGLCELCNFPLTNTTVPKHMRLFHPGCRGPCDGYAYRADGVYAQGMFVGLCGTSSACYLMCNHCRERYLLEKEFTFHCHSPPRVTKADFSCGPCSMVPASNHSPSPEC